MIRKNIQTVNDVWKDMRLEVGAQATGNRHEPNYSDNNTKLFSLDDIDEIIEKISEKQSSQNLANSVETCKIEPKFKVGDKIKYAGQSDRCAEKIIAIRNDAYYFSEVVSLPFIEQDKWELAGQNPADKVESKFKAGNWYLCVKDFLGKGVRFDKGKAYYCGMDGCLQQFDSGAHINIDEKLYDYFNLWTIQDAEDGDVLVASDDSILLFKSVVDAACKHYIALTTDNVVKINEGLEHYWETSRAVHPATKEQRDRLFQKMKEAGYEWDAEKEELIKIEQNPAWSEEDEEMFKFWNLYYKHKVGDMPNKDVVENLEKFRDWFRTLKERVQLQQEWSEEDRDYFDAIIAKLEVTQDDALLTDNQMEFLKTFKDRYTWKPSDEQIISLDTAIAWCIGNKETVALKSLLSDLKKLKG